MIAALLLSIVISAPIRSGSMAVAPRSENVVEPAAAVASGNPDSILAAWRVGDTVQVARLYSWLLADQASLQTFALQPGHSQSVSPQIATGGTVYFVAWSEWSVERRAFDVILARFSLDGHLLEGPSIVLRDFSAPATLLVENGAVNFKPAPVAACGNETLMASTATTQGVNFGRNAGNFYSYELRAQWLESGVSTSFLGAFVNPSLPQYGIPLPTAQPPAYACTPQRCVVIYHMPPVAFSIVHHLYAGALPCGGGAFSSVQQVAELFDPAFAAAANGDDILLVYMKQQSLTGVMLRVTSGKAEQVDEFSIAPDGASRPAVAAAGDGFVVAYEVQDGGGMKHLEGVRVGPPPVPPRRHAVR
jgi:hypothetical protein